MTPNKVKVRVHREGEVRMLVAALSRFLGLNEKWKRSKAAYVCQNPQVCCNLSPMGSSSIASRNNNWQSIGVTGVPSVSGKQAQETFYSFVCSEINKFEILMAIYLCQKATGQPVTWGQAHLLVLTWSTKGNLQ